VAVEDIPEDVRRFINEHITSIEQLEVLLLLKRSADREWSAAEVSRELAIHPESAAVRLTDLEGRGLLVAKPDSPPAYRYQPTSSALARVVNNLAEVYKQHRVSVITLVFSKPIDNIRSFSDAFKFRKDN
jgi:predicted ArsR family transcriptional regulator